MFTLPVLYSQKSYTFTPVDTMRLPLNDETGYHTYYSYYWEDKKGEYVAFLYRDNLQLNIYSFNKQNLIKSIQFTPEGENGVSGDLPGFCFLPDNRILVLAYFSQQLIIINLDDMKVEKRINIVNNQDRPIIEPGVFSPLLQVGNNIFLSGGLDYHYFVKQINPLIACNLQTGNQVVRGNGIEELADKVYGTVYYASYDYNDCIGKFIISHSISNFIHVTDFKETTRYPAKSKYISSVSPIVRKDVLEYDSEELKEHSLQSKYLGIKYDKYRNCYYRFVERSRSLKEAYSLVFPKFSIIILDEDFNKVSELDLPEDLNPYMFFISKKGLNFSSRKSYKKDSDFLTIFTYVLEVI